MVSVGDKVQVRGRPNLVGTVEEIVDGVAYCLMANRVEMDFPLGQIEPYSPPVIVGMRESQSDISDDWMMKHLTPEVVMLGEKLHDGVSRAFPGSTPWVALSNRQRLNVIGGMLGMGMADDIIRAVAENILSRNKIHMIAMLALADAMAA